MQVEGIQVHANEGGVTQTRGGIYWVILPAGCNTHQSLVLYNFKPFYFVLRDVLLFVYPPDLGSSFWGMVLILASTNVLAAKIAAGCLGVALLIVLFVAQNVSCFHEMIDLRLKLFY